MVGQQILIDQLLFEEEGNTLDFKSEQYRFSVATDQEKSELLKDIIAFANAWRRTDAYILIGVKEVKGGRSEIMGISEHLDDAQLQQFINSKTQRPIDFSYKTVQHDGQQIGVIQIPVQRRPFYLKNDFGKLKRNVVYIRRGSSTDIASPDEVSIMGGEANGIYQGAPSLEAFLITGQHDEIVEKRLERKLINMTIPDDEQFPDYYVERSNISGLHMLSFENQDYYRDRAKYLQASSRIRAFKIGVKNSGTIAARDVKVIFNVRNEDKSYIACKLNDLPNKPQKSKNHLPVLHSYNTIRKDPDISVKNIPQGWRLTCYLGKVQPKDMVITTDCFCIGSLISQSIRLEVQVFSDDLPEPKQEALIIDFDVEERLFSVNDFLPKTKAS